MKIHVNSIISGIKSRYMCMDVEKFYLNNQMGRTEYSIVHISMIPHVFVEKYNIKGKLNNGYIFTCIPKGVWGLPQTGRIAHDDLVKRMKPYGYRPSRKNPGLWTNDSRTINFTLVVNDFGGKFSGKEHSLNLKALLEYKYKITTDW